MPKRKPVRQQWSEETVLNRIRFGIWVISVILTAIVSAGSCLIWFTKNVATIEYTDRKLADEHTFTLETAKITLQQANGYSDKSHEDLDKKMAAESSMLQGISDAVHDLREDFRTWKRH